MRSVDVIVNWQRADTVFVTIRLNSRGVPLGTPRDARCATGTARMTADATRPHVWGNAEAYEAYMGRWSRPAAESFTAWLALSSGLSWLDVGCGTGALTRAVLAAADPGQVLGVDPSADFIATASARIVDPRARFAIGDARALPVSSEAFDAVVAGLALNFVPEPEGALAEMVRAARSGGTVAAYVWDYAGEMQLVRTFWQAAIALDPAATAHDQGRQFPICQPEPLTGLFRDAGLGSIEVHAIEVPTKFHDFDDYWLPHLLGGSGVAQRYVTTLGETHRTALRDQLETTLPIAADGSILLTARAWAVRGTK
jgi:SAM-dependent methyltransferase